MKTTKIVAWSILIVTCLHSAVQKDCDNQTRSRLPYLHYKQDRYGNLWIDIIPNQSTTKGLVKQLQKFLKMHKKKYKNSAFILNIPHEMGAYNQGAKEAGFRLHHADDDKTEWIYRNGSHIPHATTANGVARVFILRTINGQQELLLLKDKGKSYLTIPGGAIDPNEHALDAATREVKEETNLFLHRNNLKLITLTDDIQSHWYGKTHYYFYFSADDPGGKVKIDPQEQECYFWVPVDHVLNKRTVHDYEVDIIIKKILSQLVAPNTAPFHQKIPKTELWPHRSFKPGEGIDLWNL